MFSKKIERETMLKMSWSMFDIGCVHPFRCPTLLLQHNNDDDDDDDDDGDDDDDNIKVWTTAVKQRHMASLIKRWKYLVNLMFVVIEVDETSNQAAVNQHIVWFNLCANILWIFEISHDIHSHINPKLKISLSYDTVCRKAYWNAFPNVVIFQTRFCL